MSDSTLLLVSLFCIALAGLLAFRKTLSGFPPSHGRPLPLPRPTSAHPRLTFAVIVDGATIEGDITNMNLIGGSKILLRARPTHKGRPAKYQTGSAILDNGLPEDFFKVIHNPTGKNELEVLVIALEENGDEELPALGVVALDIDADPNEDVRMMRAESTVNWQSPGASVFAFDQGTPEKATDAELDEGESDGEGGGANTNPEGGDQP